jgi:molybdopterin molybdotransferase
MDGYAVHASEIHQGVSLEVVTRIAAGSSSSVATKPNQCVAIATGAPVPPQFDAVVQHELTDRGDLTGKKVTFHVDNVRVGNAIHKRGVDATEGASVIPARTILASHHIGIAATVGTTDCTVVQRPSVILLTSGDEVVGQQETPEDHQIRNGNGPMLCSLFESFGCEVLRHVHVQDDPTSTNKAIDQALQDCELLVTVGGISAGERDFFPRAFEQSGVDCVVKGAAIQPGKPVMVGRKNETIVLGLPGNPVSALACAHVFGRPIVQTMLGVQQAMQWIELPLAEAVLPNQHRTAFRPCTIVDGSILIPSWQGSGDLVHTSTTIGLAQLPMMDAKIPAGTHVPFLRFSR